MTPTVQPPETTQAPIQETEPIARPPIMTTVPPAPHYAQGIPPAGYSFPPYAVQPGFPPQQQQFFRPTGGQRVGVAVASIALLIPLLAIAIGTITSMLPYVSAGVAVTTGLIAVALVCLAVIVVNVAFNFDMLRRRQ